MQRKLVIALGGVLAGGVLAAAACFPDVTFRGAGGGGGSGTQPSSHSGSSSSGKPSSSSGGTGGHPTTTSTPSTGSTGGHPTTTSTTSTTIIVDADAGCDSGKPCDCDGDGYNAATPECNHDGGDCDDHDALVHPGQMMWFTTPSEHGLWDYNCNGAKEYEIPSTLSCTGVTSCDPNTTAWHGTTVPDCGMSGQAGVCMAYGLTSLMCKEALSGATQGCH
jgi:hypothetical protein